MSSGGYRRVTRDVTVSMVTSGGELVSDRSSRTPSQPATPRSGAFDSPVSETFISQISIHSFSSPILNQQIPTIYKTTYKQYAWIGDRIICSRLND